MTKTKKELIEAIKAKKTNTAWMTGAKAYALDLLSTCEKETFSASEIEKDLLNGADDWEAFSYGTSNGVTFIFDEDIARRVCSASELVACDCGRKEPNESENWLDVQARALRVAFHMIEECF